MSIDYQARLEKVSAAIDAILAGGQQVEYDGRRVERADLKTLQDLEARYEAKVNRAARGGGIRISGGVPE